jgi:hypothetical protein
MLSSSINRIFNVCLAASACTSILSVACYPYQDFSPVGRKSTQMIREYKASMVRDTAAIMSIIVTMLNRPSSIASRPMAGGHGVRQNLIALPPPDREV